MLWLVELMFSMQTLWVLSACLLQPLRWQGLQVDLAVWLLDSSRSLLFLLSTSRLPV